MILIDILKYQEMVNKRLPYKFIIYKYYKMKYKYLKIIYKYKKMI